MAVACVGVAFDEAAGDGHEQGPSKIGGGFVEDTGRVGRNHIPLGARRDIEVVVADGDVGYDTELWGGTEQVLVDSVRQQTYEAVFVF